MSVMRALRDAIEFERRFQVESRPLVLPDWFNTSEVSYASRRLGVVEYRGETVRAPQDIGCCPNTPRCEHPSFVHDVDTHEDPRPMCCVSGCSCGQTAKTEGTGA